MFPIRPGAFPQTNRVFLEARRQHRIYFRSVRSRIYLIATFALESVRNRSRPGWVLCCRGRIKRNEHPDHRADRFRRVRSLREGSRWGLRERGEDREIYEGPLLQGWLLRSTARTILRSWAWRVGWRIPRKVPLSGKYRDSSTM